MTHTSRRGYPKGLFQTATRTEFNFRDSYKFNMAAYELDKLLELNMVPVSVERKVGGNMAAVTWWVDDGLMTELDRHKEENGAARPQDLESADVRLPGV